MMLWEALHRCRHVPYSNYSARELRAAEHLRSGERPAIPSKWEQECPGITQLLRDCWQHHPKDRPNFLEIMGRLLTIIDAMPDTAVPPPAPTYAAAGASPTAAAATAQQPPATPATAAEHTTVGPTKGITAVAAAALIQALAARTANSQMLQQLVGALQAPALNVQQISRVEKAPPREEQHHSKKPAAVAAYRSPAATATGAAAAALQALVVQLRDPTRKAGAGHQGAPCAPEQRAEHPIAHQQQQGRGALLQVGVTHRYVVD
jgi:hypothetical protein